MPITWSALKRWAGGGCDVDGGEVSPLGAAAVEPLPAPVDELVPGRGRQQDVTRGPAAERGPDPRERVGILRRGQLAVADLGGQRAELALDAPGTPSLVAQLAARSEAQLAAR